MLQQSKGVSGGGFQDVVQMCLQCKRSILW
jgi:hypothetical protein